MFKRMTLLRRKTADAPERFQEHWARIHSTFVLQLPGIRRYVQNDIVGAVPEVRFDGIVELWFDDEAMLRTAFASAAGRELPVDEAHFLGGKIVCDVEERLVVGGEVPGTAAKLISVVHSAASANVTAWERWHERVFAHSGVLGPACARMSHHRVATEKRVGLEASTMADIAGILVYQFASPRARDAYVGSANADEIERPDGAAPWHCERILVQERVLQSR